MRHEPVRYLGVDYEPGSWRQEEPFLSRDERVFAYAHRARIKPDVWDQSRLLELLGLINYRVHTGNKVYIQVGGSVFRTLYGGYWRSVFTGTEHYLLRCEEIKNSIWSEESDSSAVDLPIVYSNDGWTIGGHSVSFMLSLDNSSDF